MTRQHKTPRQRAEETLAAANRRVVRADKTVDRLEAELVTARREHKEAVARRDYAAQDPALPKTSQGTSTTSQPITGGTTR